MKKVIFDLDGTLFQTHLTITKAMMDTLAEFKLPMVDAAAITAAIGLPTEEFLHRIMPGFTGIKEFRRQLRKNERAAVRKHGKVFDGVIELLQELIAREYQLYVCSNGSRGYIKVVLDSTGIGRYITESRSSRYQPSKATAIRQFIDTDDFAVLVGDTRIDFQGAKLAGIPSIAAVYGYGSEEECQKATFQTHTPGEIFGCIMTAELLHVTTRKLVFDNKARVIGINGVDTSGKTQFTKQFSRYLSAVGIKNEILSMDDYHNPAKLRYQGTDEKEAYYNNAFNYVQVISEVLEPLKKNGFLQKEVRCLNLDTDQYDIIRSYDIDKNTLLLVEGVLLFRDPILQYLDGKIYLHIGFNEVLRRAQLRDVPKYGPGFLQKYITKYIPVQQRYIKEYTPIEISDVVIDNTDFHRPSIILQ